MEGENGNYLFCKSLEVITRKLALVLVHDVRDGRMELQQSVLSIKDS